MTLPDLGLNIGIIESNPLLADGISALLLQESGFAAQVVFLGPTVEEVGDGCFDLVLVDPAQTSASPANLIRDLASRSGAIVAYCSSGADALARACINSGFRGVLPKTVSFDVLKIALATVASGGIFIDAAFTAAIAPDSGAEDPPHPIRETRLSERELFVLKSVAHGKSLKEIGRELDLSSKTVETYKARGTSKLNLSGRRQIVEFAIAQGWVESPPLSVG